MKKKSTVNTTIVQDNWTGSVGLKFIIAGAMRSGSTYLFELLRNHPQIDMPDIKELHYFSKSSTLRLEDYQNFFKKCDLNKTVGEASPEYMLFPYCAQRIRKHFPDIKLIFILRNPIKRAFSHYLWAIKGGRLEYLSFEKALAIENQRIETDDFSTRNAFSYRVRGEYLALLQPYLDLFPKDNIKIILFEDLRSNGQEVYNELCDFLNLDRISIPDIKRHNHAIIPRFLPLFRRLVRLRTHTDWSFRGGSRLRSFLKKVIQSWPRTKKHPQILPTTENQLKRHYSPHNQALFDFLGRNNIWD